MRNALRGTELLKRAERNKETAFTDEGAERAGSSAKRAHRKLQYGDGCSQ